MHMRTGSRRVLTSLTLLLAGVCIAQDEIEIEEEEELDRTPVKCVSMRQIEGTQIVDDQTILFYRRGGRIYMNLLERNCPTLKVNKLFRYRLTSGTRRANLCDFNAITVIDQLTDSLTYNCRLGMFHPISESQAEELLAAAELEGGAHSIAVELIEVPEEEDEAADENNENVTERQ